MQHCIFLARQWTEHRTFTITQNVYRFHRDDVLLVCRVAGSPSANLFIEPSGEVSLACTHDQMFSPPCGAFVVGSSMSTQLCLTCSLMLRRASDTALLVLLSRNRLSPSLHCGQLQSVSSPQSAQ
jgi:hypothetical protein